MTNVLYLLAISFIGLAFDNGQEPYFNVGKEFALYHSEMYIEPNKFGYNIAVRNGDSLWVCSTNSAIDFKDTFDRYNFDTVMLSVADFPKYTIIHE